MNLSTDHGIAMTGCFMSFNCWRFEELSFRIELTFGINTPVKILKAGINMFRVRSIEVNWTFHAFPCLIFLSAGYSTVLCCVLRYFVFFFIERISDIASLLSFALQSIFFH